MMRLRRGISAVVGAIRFALARLPVASAGLARRFGHLAQAGLGEALEVAVEQAVRGVEATGVQLLQELLLGGDVSLQDGTVDADALSRVGVAPTCARLAEHLRHPQGEEGLARSVRAVEHLDGVYE